MGLSVKEMIELLKQDKLLPEQVSIIPGSSNRKLRELVDRLEAKDLISYVETFESGYTRCLTLPTEVISFINLKVLDLSSARDLTHLPSEIGQLSKLEELTIYYNKNLKTLPPEIGQLRNLRKLSITSCALTELPPEIGMLESLEQLDVSSNQLTRLPQEIGNLRNLKVLNVKRNPLSSMPDEIGKLAQLERLDVSLTIEHQPYTIVLLKNCIINGIEVTNSYFRDDYEKTQKEAAKYAIASRLMAQGARTIPDSVARDVFAMPELRSHIASFVGWHPSFNSGHPNAGFAERFEAAQVQRTSISEYDFLTKIIQRPKF